MLPKPGTDLLRTLALALLTTTRWIEGCLLAL